MIRVTIKQAAKKRGFKNAYQFGQSLGLADMVAARLWKGSQLPKLKSLDRICNAWGCDLGELISYTPDRSRNGHSSTTTQKRVKKFPADSKTTASKLSGSKRG